MKIADASPYRIAELWTSVESQVQRSSYLEQASQELATAIHEQFAESVVIARVFLTVPFDALPPASRRFVQALTDSAHSSDPRAELKPATPVLSLIGTHGEEADWHDRRKSKNHVGIPLISSAFVDAIPMISRVLKELAFRLPGWIVRIRR